MAEARLRADPGDRPLPSRPAPRPAARPPRSSWRRRLVAAGFRLSLLLLLWATIIGGGVIGYFALTLPDTSRLGIATRRPSVTILAADGSLVGTYGDLFGQPLTLRQMPRWLPQAVIATEDRRFYHHFGIDPVGVARAVIADLFAKRLVQGGSTITQQLAKNLFLSPERSLGRKIREVLLALWLEHQFTKDQILEIYLNRVYLGAGAYGVDAAAHRYFDKSASRLSLYECAVIAGLLQAPTRLSPAHAPELTAARAAQVLQNMVEAGYIGATEARAAEQEGSILAQVPAARPGARYFADWVNDQLADFAGTGDRDLSVRTTLDPRLQQAAEAAIAEVLARDGERAAVGQGALVAISPDGAVRAMVGGRDYQQSQFNRATQAERQPGSAFKPFVYLAGLEAGLRPDEIIDDVPIQIGKWRPRNYTNRYQGPVTVAEGLAQSINTVAAQVAQRAGLDRVVAVAHRLGIASDLTAEPSLALGTSAVTLLELVSAYAPFANGGKGILPYGIAEIRDSAGNLLFHRTGSGPGEVVSPELDAEINDMLRQVITDGTGRAAALPWPAAGKTGTTQDYRDAWFIGYAPGLVAGVWLGNDDDTPMNKVTGGSLPARTWRQFMLAAIREQPAAAPSAPLPAPPGGFIDGLLSLLRGLGPAPSTPAAPADEDARGGQ